MNDVLTPIECAGLLRISRRQLRRLVSARLVPVGLLRSPAFGRTTATRAAWILANGPIPAGMKVLHRCDNTRCCNPGHLFLGTQQDNISDMWSKGRAKPGSRHLSKSVVFQIFRMREQGATISNIAGAHLCVSGARDHQKKAGWMLADALQLFDSVEVAFSFGGFPYMLENPVGRLSSHRRKPDYIFQPWQYGDLWTKKTCLWTGNGFRMPAPIHTTQPEGVTQKIFLAPPSDDRADIRSETPPGFAQGLKQTGVPSEFFERVAESAAVSTGVVNCNAAFAPRYGASIS